MNKKILFLVKFFTIFLLLDFIITFSYLEFLQEWIAVLEAKFINIDNEGITISSPNQTFTISQSCTGLVSIAVFAAVVFSFRKPDLKLKIISFLVGAIVLFFLNLLRIYLVIKIGLIFGTTAAEIAHVVSWLSMAAAIIALWYFSMKKFANVKNLADLL